MLTSLWIRSLAAIALGFGLLALPSLSVMGASPQPSNPTEKTATTRKSLLSPAATAPNQNPANQRFEHYTTIGGISEYRAGNGMRLLLLPDPTVDTITVNFTYLVGSRHEGYGESGMAHLLEHLLFKGTPRIPDIKAEFQKRGARWNGSTSQDRTNYYATFPATNSNLDWALGIEADRMLNANVSRKDLDSEMTVVRNEFESGENNPGSILRERTVATAFLWHGYGRAIIGARSDIENVPIERLRAFYKQYYQPDNVIVVIAGRFDPEQALRLAGTHLANLPRPARTLVPTYTVEPTQDGERLVTLRRSGDIQMVHALYHMPPGSHPDYAAVDILVAALGQTPGGRLHKTLVVPGKATSTFATERQLREAGYASFGASVRQGLSLEEARDLLVKTVESVSKEPIPTEEIERARTRLLNDTEMLLSNSRNLALALSEYVAMGDWRLVFLHRDRLRQVTPADVQRVASRYLRPANRTVGLFLPESAPERAEIPPMPDLVATLRDYRTESGVAQGEAFEPTPAAIEARTIRRTLPGGMQVALFPKKTRGGTVTAQISLRWGDEHSKSGRATACSMASALLQRGTQKKSREQIANEFTRLRAQVGIGGEGGSIETVRENLHAALTLVAEILRQPSFPSDEFEQLRQSTLAAIESQISDPGARVGIEVGRHLNPFPENHWFYNPTPQERIERLKSVTLDSVRSCHQQFVGASHASLAVVGDFDPDDVTELATKLFSDWKSPAPYSRIALPFAEVPRLDLIIETPDKANAVYRAAQNLNLRDDDPEYPALVLGNYLLGGSSAARLSRRIREKEGISYSVGSVLSASSFDRRGTFMVFGIHAPQNRVAMERLVMEEISRVLESGFSDTEFDSAKKGYLQERQVARNQDGAIASRLLSYLELNRTLAWDADFERRIAALTRDDVLAALRKHLDARKMTVVRAGDFRHSPTASTVQDPRPGK